MPEKTPSHDEMALRAQLGTLLRGHEVPVDEILFARLMTEADIPLMSERQMALAAMAHQLGFVRGTGGSHATYEGHPYVRTVPTSDGGESR